MGLGQEEKRIVASIFKALKDRHETLYYFRVAILEAFKENLENLKEDDIKHLLEELKYEQTKAAGKI